MTQDSFSQYNRHSLRSFLLLCLCVLYSVAATAQYTRGIGIYPGNPDEFFGPKMVPDNATRNLALHRAVYQSSAHDKNLTAQLLTDGELFSGMPTHLEVLCNGKPLTTTERERTINQSEWSTVLVMGSEGTMTYQWTGMDIDADEVTVEGYVAYNDQEPFQGYTFTCETSEGQGKVHTAQLKGTSLPGKPYKQRVSSDPNKQTEGEGKPARDLKETFSLKGGKAFRTLKLTLSQNNALYWVVKEVSFHKKGKPVEDILPVSRFNSAWLTDGQEWAYVDLGTPSDISEVRLHAAKPSGSCTIDISQDAKSWQSVGSMDTRQSSHKAATLSVNKKARYVRVTTQGPAAISELEVMGRGGMRAEPQPTAGMKGDRFFLNGGDWTLCPVVVGKTAEPCGPAIVATVPATVLSSYYNVGALPDPNYDDNLSMISETFFHRDFLYKRKFQRPKELKGTRVLLNFDGINWKADVSLNGERLGRIEGAFKRGQFDITDLLRDENTLEVLIHRVAHPGSVKTKTHDNTSFNGGVLGADNPTFHATIGWDWITTTPGRDIGIWNDVYLTTTDAVTILDPLVLTKLDEEGLATMTPRVFLRNHSRETVTGILQGFIGDIRFEKNVILESSAEKEITFNPGDFPQLSAQQMKLWWPTGYGRPDMYQAGYTFVPTNTNSQQKVELTYQTGIREVTYKDEMKKLQLYINGMRLVPLGGNWGFSESHLNYRGREYDTAVRYHRLMNYNMIRNWVGMTGDEEFYEACDRYGVMVWQDFWLANPVDGPNPDNEKMFMDNATDYVRRIRQHPSIALYCGRNEGYPPETLNKELDAMTKRLMPGSLYIPSSADDGVSGHGPYQARPEYEYFENQTGKLHSERGMPNVPNVESLRRMLAPEHCWPQNDYWGKHDFTVWGGQCGASFNILTEQRFGPLRLQEGQDSVSAFTALAQWCNYDGYRAMYEASNTERQGLLIWMSHCCWPSMVWQTYDYYFDPTAAFFGVRKACEPLHVQYNALTRQVQLVNLSAGTRSVTVTAVIYDLHGKPLWKRTAKVETLTDSTADCFEVSIPEGLRGTYFLSLTWNAVPHLPAVSPNVYVLSTTDNQRDLWTLPRVKVDVRPSGTGRSDEFVISNPEGEPAVMIRLCLKGANGGEQILPVEYSENFFHLMPGQRMPVRIHWDKRDARGATPILQVSGFNVSETLVTLEP